MREQERRIESFCSAATSFCMAGTSSLKVSFAIMVFVVVRDYSLLFEGMGEYGLSTPPPFFLNMLVLIWV